MDLVLFPNDIIFWATHEVAQAPTSRGRSLLLSKRQEVRVIKLRSRKEERKGEDQSAAFPRRREASQCLEYRPPQTSDMIKQLNSQKGSSDILLRAAGVHPAKTHSTKCPSVTDPHSTPCPVLLSSTGAFLSAPELMPGRSGYHIEN